ncbi:MAG: LptF/LptG family permease [Thermodesulfobacteriota bacterium]
MGLSIIDRYVFRELVASFFFCLAIFLVTGLIAGFLPLLQKGIEHGLTLTMILFQVLINALPSTLVSVLPLSLTIGILLGLGRMTADNEIAALKSAGISVVRLLPPVMLLGCIGFALSLACTLVLIPAGISRGHELMREALTARPIAGIEERTFHDNFKDLILYVEKIEPGTEIMKNVFIRESSDPDDVKTILARQGKVAPDPQGKDLVLNLNDGVILREDRLGDSKPAIEFKNYVFRYSRPNPGPEVASKSLEENTVSEIVQRIRRARAKQKTTTGQEHELYQREERLGRIFLTQRFVHPLACMALALMAFPLGVLGMGKSRLNNVALGLGAIFVYYALALATERLARSGLAQPEPVLFLPPVLFVAAAAYFIHCVRLERVPGPLLFLRRGLRLLRGSKF